MLYDSNRYVIQIYTQGVSFVAKYTCMLKYT